MAENDIASLSPEEQQQLYPFTCVACSLAFSTSTIQRQHFTTDLHRYNAKRRIVNLTPVSAQFFNEKVAQHRQQQGKTEQDQSGSKLECKVCKKHFSTKNSYDDHLKSKKHRETASKKASTKIQQKLSSSEQPVHEHVPSSTKDFLIPSSATDAEIKEVATQILKTIPPVPPLECLFCHPSTRFSSTVPKRKTQTKEENEEADDDDKNYKENESHLVNHMKHAHGFHIPDQEYLVDRTGLLKELAVKIGTWNVCLFCDASFGTGRSDEPIRRRGLEAVRKHMVDKCHCKLPWDTEAQRLEYSDHYDYSSSYPDFRNNDDGEEDWEDIQDQELNDNELADHISKLSLYGNQQEIRFGDTIYELVLPTGTRIGHRALRRVYRQNLIPYMNNDSIERNSSIKHLTPTERRKYRNDKLDLVLLSRNQHNGALISAASPSQRNELKRFEKKTRQEWRKREFERTRVSTRSGNDQKHFRDQLLQ